MTDAAEFAYNNMMDEKEEHGLEMDAMVDGLSSFDVKQMRSELGYTQKNFAAMLGVTRSAVSNWEAGKGVRGAPAKLIEAILSLRDLQRKITMGV
jgi:DNA-binding transcriptional regulator YiaG|tara:strand:+ start:2018 stop:2302 length:285 start_codon:yes stop_codon:yes gene_type:complete